MNGYKRTSNSLFPVGHFLLFLSPTIVLGNQQWGDIHQKALNLGVITRTATCGCQGLKATDSRENLLAYMRNVRQGWMCGAPSLCL